MQAHYSIVDDIKDSFKKGGMLTRLIYVNLGVFLFIQIFIIIDALFKTGWSALVISWLSVPSIPRSLLFRPWTLITYMFLHYQFFHLLSNLLWLYWFGKIFLSYHEPKRLLNVYLLGGISGALLYFVAYNAFPGLRQDAILFGASAAVMAVVVGIATYSPNHELHLIFIGPVKIKYIALISFLLTSVTDFTSNTGGKIAHIGGALFGYLYFIQLSRGKDIASGFSRFLDGLFSLFKSRKRMKVTYKRSVKNMTDMEYNRNKAEKQAEIDRILEKIARAGYDSLTKKEKETLFKMSNKN
ncbi:MAG: rhomboid family intramembrane serine protease [Bacteroidales bacterium]|nr:rhomboid family intramembrane serine protease [Bacteroidales bacterium]